MPERIFDVLEGMMSQANEESDQLIKAVNKMLEMFPEKLSGFLNLLAYNARDIWAEDAINASPWGTKYASALAVEPASPGGEIAKVYVDDSVETVAGRGKKPASLFVNMMEFGVKSWSIKKALMKSKRVKVSSQGIKYITIPFRQRTPEGKGKSQKKSSEFAGVMSSQIHALVEGGGAVKGEKYGHMAGLTKVEKPGHSQYFTFRTVTQDTEGWMHPGKAKTAVYEKSLKKIQKMIQENIEVFLKAIVEKAERGI